MYVANFRCFAFAKKNLEHSSPWVIHSTLHCCLIRARLDERMAMYLSRASFSWLCSPALVESSCSLCCTYVSTCLAFSCWIFRSAKCVLFRCLSCCLSCARYLHKFFMLWVELTAGSIEVIMEWKSERKLHMSQYWNCGEGSGAVGNCISIGVWTGLRGHLWGIWLWYNQILHTKAHL